MTEAHTDNRLSKSDYEAADEVLGRIPELAANFGIAQARELLAASHQRMGASRFRLFWGLRGPESCCEELELRAYLGHASKAEFAEHLLWHIDNDLSAAKLARYFDELEKRIGQYSEIRGKVEGYVYGLAETPSFSALEEEVNNLVADLYGRSSFYRAELVYIPLFLAEARTEQGKEAMQHKSLGANSAASLVALTIGLVKKGWAKSYELARNHPAARPPSSFALFEEDYLRQLPRPLDLSTWLEEEHVLGRRFLRMRTPHSPASQKIVAECVEVAIQGDKVAINIQPVAPQQAADDEQKAKNPVVTVATWSELAIGIDAHGYWAVTTSPEFGSKFVKEDSTNLDLRGERWKSLLTLAAGSPDGQTIEHGDLIRALNYLPPTSQIENDSRARPDAIRGAHREYLTQQAGTALKKLNSLLSDLRRELRELVVGPSKRGTLLKSSGLVIRTGFRVAPLLSDASGHLRFGDARRES